MSETGSLIRLLIMYFPRNWKFFSALSKPEFRREEGVNHQNFLGNYVTEPEGKRPLGRPRRRREDNIKIVFQEVGCGGRDWIGLAQVRDRWRALVNAVMNLRFP
jgi:hypothetical protein